MRKPDAGSVAADKITLPEAHRSDAPTALVCLALALALLALAARIAGIW